MMPIPNPKKWLSPPALGLLLLLCLLSAVLVGPYSVQWSEFIRLLSPEANPTTRFLLFQIRVPRILLAALVGAGLAISGAAIQGLFRNPLADQTLIGVSSGAMLFAILSMVFFGTTLATASVFLKQLSVGVAAFFGGLLTTYLVYALARKNGRTQVLYMLLAGIAVSAFAAAVSGFFIYWSDDQQLRDITFWSLGSLSGSNWTQFSIAGPVILAGIFFISRESRALNAILLGEKEALYLGIAVEKVKFRVITWCALLVGVCIALTGIIGFVGLIIPHFLRLQIGSDYKDLLPKSALAGAIFLVFSDTLARTLIAPAELPIGILTAFIGAPFFLWLLLRSRYQML